MTHTFRVAPFSLPRTRSLTRCEDVANSKRLKQVGIDPHRLEVEYLQPVERERVADVVEQRRYRPPSTHL